MSWWKIFSAVLVANLVTFVVIPFIGLLIAAGVMGVALSGLSDALNSRQNTISAAPSVVRPSVPKPNIAKPQPRELVFSKEAIARNKQMCDYWTAQYRQDGLTESEAYRDLACIRYRKSLTTYKD